MFKDLLCWSIHYRPAHTGGVSSNRGRVYADDVGGLFITAVLDPRGGGEYIQQISICPPLHWHLLLSCHCEYMTPHSLTCRASHLVPLCCLYPISHSPSFYFTSIIHLTPARPRGYLLLPLPLSPSLLHCFYSVIVTHWAWSFISIWANDKFNAHKHYPPTSLHFIPLSPATCILHFHTLTVALCVSLHWRALQKIEMNDFIYSCMQPKVPHKRTEPGNDTGGWNINDWN